MPCVSGTRSTGEETGKGRWSDMRPRVVRAAEQLCSASYAGGQANDIAHNVLEVCDGLGAVGSLVLLADESGNVVDAGSAGVSGDVFFSGNPLIVTGRRTPSLDAMHNGYPVWIRSVDEMRALYREFTAGIQTDTVLGGMAALPLWAGVGVIGAVSVVFPGEVEFGIGTQSFLTLIAAEIARQVGQAGAREGSLGYRDLALLERMHDPVLVYDARADRFDLANAAALELLRCDRHTVLHSAPAAVFNRLVAGVGRYVEPEMLEHAGIHAVTLRGPDETEVLCELHVGERDSHGRQLLVIVDRTEEELEHDLLMESAAEFRVAEERERLARDLHDGVIQSLFATALTLAAAPMREHDEISDTVKWAVSELDSAIRDIRATVFDLAAPDQHDGAVRAAVQRLVRTAERAAGISVSVEIGDGIDSALDEEHLRHVLRVLRESLSNVARHAHATTAMVRLSASDEQVEVLVEDDGVGVSETAEHGDGLRNLVNRARSIGGECEIRPRPGGGTAVRWVAPLGSTLPAGTPGPQMERCS